MYFPYEEYEDKGINITELYNLLNITNKLPDEIIIAHNLYMDCKSEYSYKYNWVINISKYTYYILTNYKNYIVISWSREFIDEDEIIYSKITIIDINNTSNIKFNNKDIEILNKIINSLNIIDEDMIFTINELIKRLE